MLRAVVWFAVCVLAVAAPARAAPDPAALRAAAEDIRATANVRAMGLGVIDKGKVVFLGGFGEIDGRPATERDRFRAASISKLFTAQAIYQLQEAGKLSLDDDVSRWFPAFAGRGLTIRLLLAHRSGLRDAVFPRETSDPLRVKAYVDILARQTPARAPGSAYAYTDADYNLLGAVVEAVSGTPFPAYVTAKLLQPLELSETRAFPLETERAGIAQPFRNKPEVRPATPRPYDIAFAPSEGLLVGARDLTLWVQATLAKNPRLLKAATFEAMLQPLGEGSGPGRGAGSGWQLRQENGRRVAEHGGSVRGYNALVLTYPDQGRAFVILTNADDAPRWEIARALDRLLGP